MEYKAPNKYPNQVIVKETTHWYITLWENQYYFGRATIEYKDMSKKTLSDLDSIDAEELFSLIKSYEKTLIKTFETTNFNWTCLMNDSFKERNCNNQEPLHLHVWPRYSKEVEFAGEVFRDEVFAHHYDKHKEKLVDRSFLVKIADRLNQNWVS